MMPEAVTFDPRSISTTTAPVPATGERTLPGPGTTPGAAGERLVSLDAYRGLIMVTLMAMVTDTLTAMPITSLTRRISCRPVPVH